MKDINRPVLWIVVPCFNEEEVLPQTAPMLKEVLSDMVTQGKIHESSAILFVNDGSSDSTWELIRQFAADSPQIRGISLSRNRGHQNALLAGLMEAKDMCDITISIDCDGQDDLQAMYEMVDKYREGFDIVYGVRSDRETDTWFKRTSAQVYYKTLNRMGAEVVYNHADYRLVSSLVLQEFSDFQEVNLFRLRTGLYHINRLTEKRKNRRNCFNEVSIAIGFDLPGNRHSGAGPHANDPGAEIGL